MKPPAVEVDWWEFQLVRKVAARFYTREREDLEAELLRHLVGLKLKRSGAIRDWQAYLAKFLLNRASNLVRDSRTRERRTFSLSHVSDGSDVLPNEGAVEYTENNHDRAALEELWSKLPRRLRHVWGILLEENGNQVQTAKRVGKHRNTVRMRVNEIRKVLQQHGF